MLISGGLGRFRRHAECTLWRGLRRKTMHVNVQSLSGNRNDRRLVNDISRTVERDLHRYDGRIRKVDVLILDEDESPDDKWCVVEARVAGWEPIAVRAHAGSFERAVHAGAAKIDEVIGETIDARRVSADAETIDWAPGASKE
jgi:hypothetical protein